MDKLRIGYELNVCDYIATKKGELLFRLELFFYESNKSYTFENFLCKNPQTYNGKKVLKAMNNNNRAYIDKDKKVKSVVAHFNENLRGWNILTTDFEGEEGTHCYFEKLQ